MMRGLAQLSLGSVLALGVSSPALAADPKVAAVIARACAVPGMTTPAAKEQLRARLAEGILSHSGVLVTDLMTEASVDKKSLGDLAVQAVRRPNGRTVEGNQVITIRDLLEAELLHAARGPADKQKIKIINPPVPTLGWLFAPTSAPAIYCAGDGTTSTPGPFDDFEDSPQYAVWALREKVDELAFTGDDARGAGAATIGLQRVRTEEDDGSKKISTTLTVNGTLGIRLPIARMNTPIYVYGSYALSRERTKGSDEDESDGDVNALEAGISFARLRLGGPSASLRAAYVNDFANDARRIKFAGSLFPGWSGPWGPLCNIGSYRYIPNTNEKLLGKCLLVFEAEGSHVFEAGSTDFKDRGKFAAVGGRAAYQLGIVSGSNMDILGTVGFRYLPTIFGEAPNIKRWDASLKYRLWTDDGFGLDFGITWAKGNDPISYAKEDRIELGFGLIR